MRYLVTGGAGFIGSHLCDALAAEGNQVTVLDNLSTGCKENIEHLATNVRLVHGSVLDELLVDEVVRESDVVVHLAAAVGVRLIVERPLHSFLTNVRGTEVVLESAHRHQRKVLVASSSEVYGKSGGPFREDDDRVLGSNAVSRWSYATSKAVDEILALAYHRERGLPAVVVRFFNCVGPRQSSAYGMVLPNLVEQALAGRPLTVHGDGLQTRCFCHVRDVVNALLRLIHDPRAEGEVFNVGSTEEVSILELARRVVSATGSASPVRLVPYEEAYGEGYEDMRRRVPDISRVRALTGWMPRMSLDEIIAELIAAADPTREIGSRLVPVGGQR
jgi:UDP-glucose 4-epimerase